MNIHASCFKLGRCGVLVLGPSGSGKSDLTLRAIFDKKAKLIADDRVDFVDGIASVPQNLAGMLEVRGIGIVKLPYLKKCRISLVVELASEIERMPESQIFHGIKKIKINPFEQSALDKIIVACK